MSEFRRQTLAGAPKSDAPSSVSECYVIPVGGFTDKPDILAPADSIVSGQNVWVREDSLQVRHRLSRSSLATVNFMSQSSIQPYEQSTGTNIVGAFAYFELSNSLMYPVVGLDEWRQQGKHTFQYISGSTNGNNDYSWSNLSAVKLAYILPQSIASNWFATNVYSAFTDRNLLVIAGGSSSLESGGLFCWAGPIGDPTTYSVLTGSPMAYDVCTFDNRVVAWNSNFGIGTGIGSGLTRIPQRVTWCVAGDPTDWTGIGSGSEDLVDMLGAGTRIFTHNDEMVLASNQELWRGRAVGLPYVFQFSPIDRQIGMPYPRAVIQTSLGLFWLNNDYLIYSMVGETINIISKPIQRKLMNEMVSPELAFLSFHPTLKQLRLFYTTQNDIYPRNSATYHFKESVWTWEVYGHNMVRAMSVPNATSTALPLDNGSIIPPPPLPPPPSQFSFTPPPGPYSP